MLYVCVMPAKEKTADRKKFHPPLLNRSSFYFIAQQETSVPFGQLCVVLVVLALPTPAVVVAVLQPLSQTCCVWLVVFTYAPRPSGVEVVPRTSLLWDRTWRPLTRQMYRRRTGWLGSSGRFVVDRL